MISFFKKNWFGLITALSSFSILLLALLMRGDVSDVKQELRTVDVLFVFIGFVFVFVYWCLDGVILFLFTKLKYKEQKYVASLKTAIIGLLYSALTPFAIGGQPMQIVQMSKANIETGDAISIITIKSVLYQGILTICSVFAIFFIGKQLNSEIAYFNIAVVFGLAANLIFIIVVIFIMVNDSISTKIAVFFIHLLAKLKLVKEPEKQISKAKEQIDIFHKSSYLLFQNRRIQISTILLTLLQLLLFYSITYIVYRSFHLQGAQILYILSIQAIITMVTAFVPLPGGSGAAEGSFYLIFQFFFTGDSIVTAIFLWRFLTYYLVIIVGGLVSFYDVVGGAKKQREGVK